MFNYLILLMPYTNLFDEFTKKFKDLKLANQIAGLTSCSSSESDHRNNNFHMSSM